MAWDHRRWGDPAPRHILSREWIELHAHELLAALMFVSAVVYGLLTP